ncbi:hypothetical protein CR513_53581, partial [Mucuna pruriens]
MKYLVGQLVGIVRADQHIARGANTGPPPRVGPSVGSKIQKKTKIEVSLDQQVEGDLIQVLHANWDTFVWTPTDMPGIDSDFLCHQLEEKKIRRREEEGSQGRDSQTIAIKYPSWLSNMVMVKKPSGKWRMCTDYTNLNKTCLKDSYPLPSIDALIDEASGYDLLSSMDAYLGYNQIRMHPCDESKIAFIMDEDNFCHRVMPFDLKNARATY